MALQEAGTTPKQYVPNFLLRGWQQHIPKPAPTPLTSRQRALTLSLCVLSNLPNIAARSLSTVLFHAHFPSPEESRDSRNSLDGCVSHCLHHTPACGDPLPPSGRKHGLSFLAWGKTGTKSS